MARSVFSDNSTTPPPLGQDVCLAGTFGKDGSRCTVCAKGHFCPKNCERPIPCEKGKFAINPAVPCKACAAGFFCAQEGTAEPTACQRGWHCPEGSVAPTLCQHGKFSPEPKVACMACVAGRFQASAGKAECNKCKSGRCASPHTRLMLCPRMHVVRRRSRRDWNARCGPATHPVPRQADVMMQQTPHGLWVDSTFFLPHWWRTGTPAPGRPSASPASQTRISASTAARAWRASLPARPKHRRRPAGSAPPAWLVRDRVTLGVRRWSYRLGGGRTGLGWGTWTSFSHIPP